ncbi:hypothetical protein E1285_44510, partial [Actinomadura sp. 7K507]
MNGPATGPATGPTPSPTAALPATRPHSRRRAPGAAAGTAVAASAAAGPLAAGTVLLLADALGGVVGVPGDVVTYIALTGLLLACVMLPAALWLARRTPVRGLVAAAGALAGLAVVAAGLVPAVPVFATALMAAGIAGDPREDQR